MINRGKRMIAACLLAILPFSTNGQELINRPDTGEPLRWEFLVVILGVLYVIFRFFGVKEKESDMDDLPPPPPPPPPMPPPMPPPAPVSKPLSVQASEAIEEFHEVGKNVQVGGKRISPAGDTETYLMMAKVDKAYIRKEERLIAEERYAQYEETIEKMKMTIMILAALLVIMFFIASWSLLVDIYHVISTYISAWLSSE